MPLLADRVKESTTTQGTGTLTLAGAPPGFRTFTGAFGNGASVYYVIAGPTEWEIGFGTTGAGTLTRDTVLVSSAGGTTKVNLSAGTKDVFCSYVADRAVTTSDAATLTNKTIDDYTNNVGANSTHFRIKASGTLAKGTVVKAVGFTPGEQAIEVAATSSASDVALGISEQALTTGQFGMAVVIGELFDVNTNGLAVGATLYSNNAGSYTTTKPSSGLYQSLGWVVRANLNNGVIAVNVVAPLYVEASTNTASTSVLRDGSGNFAAGTITAALTGNASTATALQTARNINGVSFNGTADITVTAAAGTLTGSTLASGVTASSLTSVGTLTSLTVSGNTTLNSTSGNTLIGTTTVAYSGTKLNIGTTSDSHNGVQIQTSTTGNGYVLFGDGAGADAYRGELRYNHSTDTFSIGTAGVARLAVDGSGNLAVDTDTLFVDAANNRVGVGTASPVTALQVNKSSQTPGDTTPSGALLVTNTLAGNGCIEIGAGASTLGWIQVRNSTTSAFYDLVVQPNAGNLGLGVTPSAWGGLTALQVGAQASISADGTSIQVGANAYFNSGWKYIGTGNATNYYQLNGAHVWRTAASGTAGNAITFTQAMTLDASGNLLVGPTSSSYRLHVSSNNSTAYSTSDFDSFRNLLLQNANTTTSANIGLQFLVGGNSEAAITAIRTADGEAALAFGTRSAGSRTERARITSAGSFVAGGSVALATTATDGFLYVPTCAGTPTGTPTAITGMAPIVVDTTNNKLYFYSGAQWRDAGP